MNNPKKNGLYDLGHTEDENAEAETFEFDDIRSSIAKYSKGKYSYDEPYIKNEDKEKMEEERKKADGNGNINVANDFAM